MKLTREKVLQELVSVLQETQQVLLGEPVEISENTVPIGDLDDFDSLTSVDVTVRCLVALGFDEFPAFPTLFISKSEAALTVGEVADRILNLN